MSLHFDYSFSFQIQTHLTRFWLMFPFHVPWKLQETKGLLLFLAEGGGGVDGGLKWEHWPEMG